MGLFLSFVIRIHTPDVLFIGGAAVAVEAERRRCGGAAAGDGRRCGEVRPAAAT